MLAIRQRQHERALRLVEVLSQNPAGHGAAEVLAQTLIATDPSAEEAHRALIRLALSQGKKSRALKLLAALQAVLEEEFGTGPDAETLALFDAAPEPTEAPAAEASTAAAPRATAREPVARPDGAVPQRAAPTAHATAEFAEPQAAAGRPSIAILPFRELGCATEDFFAEGLINEVTSALSQMRDFFVIARQSAYAYKGRTIDARTVGRELGARYIVEGTVQRGKSKVLVNVQLVDAPSAMVVWAGRFENAYADSLDLQWNIARRIAGAILPSVRGREIKAHLRKPPEALDAYGLVLQAYPKFWSQRPEDNDEAIRLLGRATGQNPALGIAHALKGWCHAQCVCYLWATDAGTERELALHHAKVAAEYCEDDATCMVGIGATLTMVSNQQALARHFIDRSLSLDPCNAWAWMRDGWLRVLSGDAQKGLESLGKAEELSPLDPFLFNIYFGQAMAWSQLNEIERAIELVYRGMQCGPTATWANRMLVSFYARTGNTDLLNQSLAALRACYPDITISRIRDSLPPAMVENNPKYLEMLGSAGIPDQ
jgi:TolB-like protein